MQQLYDCFGLNAALFHLINSAHMANWGQLMLAMTRFGHYERYPNYLAFAPVLSACRRPAETTPRPCRAAAADRRES